MDHHTPVGVKRTHGPPSSTPQHAPPPCLLAGTPRYYDPIRSLRRVEPKSAALAAVARDVASHGEWHCVQGGGGRKHACRGRPRRALQLGGGSSVLSARARVLKREAERAFNFVLCDMWHPRPHASPHTETAQKHRTHKHHCAHNHTHNRPNRDPHTTTLSRR